METHFFIKYIRNYLHLKTSILLVLTSLKTIIVCFLVHLASQYTVVQK